MKPDDQAMRDLQKHIRDLEEENASLKKSDAHLHQRPEVKYQFIHDNRFEFPVQKMCRLLKVARSGYYTWLKRPESERAGHRKMLIKQVYRIFVKSRCLY